MLAIVCVAVCTLNLGVFGGVDEEKCFGDPRGIVAYAKYGEEFAGATLSNDSFTDPALHNFNISTSFSVTHQHAAALVYKSFNVVFDVNSTPVENISVFPGVTTDDRLLGQAFFSQRKIVIYVENVPNYDAFIAVLIHEILHFMGFGTLAHASKSSFTSRTSPFTLAHSTSDAVLQCAQQRDNNLQQLYADSSRSHWNASMQAFSDDIMLPFINFGQSLLTKCTVLEVLESRPWGHRLCNTDTDCTSETSKCVSLGRHWPNVCRSPRVDHSSKRRVPTAQFLIFSSVIFILFVGLKACHRRPLDIYAPFVTTKSIRMKY
jgi:hypothetical protein